MTRGQPSGGQRSTPALGRASAAWRITRHMLYARQMDGGTTRKLAAIMSADVAGYSRLMGADEDGTLAALKAHRNAVDPVIFSHGGRVVKTTGDGLLLEFPTVVAAVRTALQAQQIMAERDALLPAERRMQFRIGIHVGEVIVDGEDLFGDTVNVAARLQGLAEPGGITLSGAARDAAYRQVEAPMVDLGPQALKNIAEPVRAWRVEMAATEQAGQQAAAARPEAERSAIAVLPFDNMSNDPEQDYFVDGITEDLITTLSLFKELKVIARNSTFAYKGKARDVRLIAAELDARYVIEGSARKAGNRVRITAQLIDAQSGQHLWAERYDRELTDIFAVQDEITANIASRAVPALRTQQMESARRRGSGDLDVWDMYWRVLYHFNRLGKDDVAKALDLCRRILARDENFAPAYYSSAALTFIGSQQGYLKLSREIWQEGMRNVEKGVALANDDFAAHAWLASLYSYAGRHEAALDHGHQAVSLNGHAYWSYLGLGMAQLSNGDHDEAAANLEIAWRLGINDPGRYHCAGCLAFVYYQKKEYDASLSWADQCLQLWPESVQANNCRAAALAQLGRLGEAGTALRPFLERFPGITASRYLRNFNWRRKEDLEHYREALIKAGVPA
ncbi:MAG: adenylate cyclase [Alphaproteobacteria bacterium]|nr:adenylate cyclase [Alphaproteobacteria bacterium]